MRRVLIGAALLGSAAAVPSRLPNSGGWAGGAARLLNGASWDDSLGAVALPAAWPPAVVALPPMFLGAAPGFTLTAWVWAAAPGPVWTLGAAGDAADPEDWGSSGAEFLRVDAAPGGTTVSWAARGAGPFSSGLCADGPDLAPGWNFVGLSVSATRWALMRGSNAQYACGGALPASRPPARWWTVPALGGGTFSGWVASAVAYDDVAMVASAMNRLAAGTPICGTRPAPAPAWQAGAPVAAAWASSLAPAGCLSAATGAPARCDAAVVANSWPGSAGGCGANFVVAGGGADVFPALTLDLGVRRHVTAVRVYAAAQGADPYVSYAVLVGDVRPQGAGEPLGVPFFRSASQSANRACVLQDPSNPQQRGRAATLACGAWGRYVTLQLLASDAGGGALRICQLVALTDAVAAPPPPPRAAAAQPGALALAAAPGVAHRYVGGGGAASASGNRLLDLAGSVDGALSGAAPAPAGDALQFDGAAPCVAFDAPLAPAGGAFSLVVRLTAPPAFAPHQSTVVWESALGANATAGARLYLDPGGESSHATLALAYGTRSLALGGGVMAGSRFSAAVVCGAGAACTLTRGL